LYRTTFGGRLAVVDAVLALTLPQLAQVLRVGLVAWLLALAVIVLWRLLVEGQLFHGLLVTKAGGGMEPDRWQFLLATGGGAITYVALSAQAVAEGAARMPDAPQELLTVMAASQAVYLGGKIGRTRG
jgi:hypothetical protein